MLLTMAASIMGMRTVPELVAVLPITPCTNRGKNMRAPNMLADWMALATAETEKMRLWNRRGLRTGSAARISCR